MLESQVPLQSRGGLGVQRYRSVLVFYGGLHTAHGLPEHGQGKVGAEVVGIPAALADDSGRNLKLRGQCPVVELVGEDYIQ